jgi:GR25 family glycosyltransferase involved in LPS biosynthesis
MENILTPFNFFDKIVCLSHDPNRWDPCQDTFDALNIKDRVIKYKGDNPLQEYINRGIIPQQYDTNHIDVIHARRGGCSLSHLNIIKMAKENNFNNVLIFEDDVILNHPANEVLSYLNAAINELPKDWELFYLTASPTHIYGHVPPVTDYSQHLCKVHAAHTTHAIAINSNIFDEIVENSADMDTIIRWTETWVGIDVFYIKKIQCRGHTFMPKKLLLNQKNCFSDIENCLRNNGDFIKQSYNNYEPLIKEPLS